VKLKILKLKTILWIIVVLLLSFSFPIQVIMFSPLPSIFPYIGFIFIILITAFYNNKKIYTSGNTRKINLMISVYVTLVIFHGTWQSIFNFITFNAAISSIIIYVFPVLFYFYFSRYASEQEIRTVIATIAISGLISGIYFLLDSYAMLVLGQVSDFSYKMIDYTIMRAPPGYEPNLARIAASNRSHGLLENHSISAAWISISCFSILALLPRKEIFKRSLIIAIFGVFLFLSLNFTAIISFFIVVMFIEFQGHLLMKAVIAKSSFKKIAIISILFFLFGFVLVYNLKEMADIIKNMSLGQMMMLTGEVKLLAGDTFISRSFTSFIDFPKHMLSFPPGILIGDGFSTWSNGGRGGDFGHAETLHQLGLPFYIAVIIGLFKLIKLSLYKIQILNWEIDQGARYLYFAGCIILYLLLTTIHYTTWSVKSLLPIFFISIAIFSRYLPIQYKPVKL
jgi:hypothetical protein